jgi:hypothetical protein
MRMRGHGFSGRHGLGASLSPRNQVRIKHKASWRWQVGRHEQSEVQVMDPLNSFLFFLLLLLLVALATAADMLSWFSYFRSRRVRKATKRPQTAFTVTQGTVQDRKRQ